MSEDKKGMMNSIQEMAKNLGLGKVTFGDDGISIGEKEETTEVETEVKEVNLGEFKPKRKFISFISGVSGARVRFNRESAFVKGEKLSGMLEGAIFKITICDEGTINFEEVEGTTLSDAAMRQRLLDDIDSMDVTGYTQKYVVANLEFTDMDGNRCYLEVEEAKPIDKLRLLFGSDEEETKVVEPVQISAKGLSILDQLFGGDDTDETEEVVDTPVVEVEEDYMAKQFRLMNEAKVVELQERIENSKKDIRKYNMDIKNAETNLKKVTDGLGVLESRLESLTPFDAANGYVFFISEEKKNIEGLNEDELKITNRIADLMNLKKDVLVKHLTEGFYTIKIAKKDDFEDKTVDKEIYKTIIDLDILGKTSVTDANEFEYRGSLNWHQLVQKMLRKGFEQEPEFDKIAGSNSYESKEEIATEMNVDGFVLKSDGGFADLGNGVYGVMPTPSTSTNTSSNTSNEEVPTESKEVRTFDKPTNLVIVGTGNDGSDLQITDDYTSYDVYIGGKEQSFSTESDGFVTIMEVDEYKQWLSTIDVEDAFDAIDCLFLPNFQGTIGAVAKTEEGDFSTDFHLGDYVCHQFDDYVEVGLVLPEGTTVIQMKDGQIPLDVVRDMKIESILETETETQSDKYVVIVNFTEDNDTEVKWDIVSDYKGGLITKDRSDALSYDDAQKVIEENKNDNFSNYTGKTGKLYGMKIITIEEFNKIR